jgi:tetratricopeptide (TPR) repeat protein
MNYPIRILFLISISFHLFESHAQIPQNLELQYIGFSTSYQRDLFTNESINSFEKNLRYLLSVNPASGEEDFKASLNKLESSINAINTPAFDKKSDKSKVQLVNRSIQTEYLKYLSDDARFDRLFSDGAYNSVSASAIFALVFERLAIPHEIRLVADGAIVVAYPSTLKIVIDPSNIQKNLNRMDESVKKSFLSFLSEQKKITADDEQGNQRDEIFNQYFFGEPVIRLEALASMEYMFDGIYENSRGNTRLALDQMLKSYLLKPGPRHLFYIISLLGDLYRKSNFDQSKEWDLFIITSWFVDLGVTNDQILTEYNTLTNNQLIQNSNIDLYSKMSDYILPRIKNLMLRSDLEFLYQFEKGRYYYSKANYSEAGKCLESAYLLKPKNIEIQAAFVSSVFPMISGLTAKGRVEKLEAFVHTFPDLQENGNYVHLLLLAMLDYFTLLYDNQEIETAEYYRTLFEQLVSQNKEINLGQSSIGEAYTSAALYYFRKGQNKKAREILLKGLELSPGNDLLKYRLKSI